MKPHLLLPFLWAASAAMTPAAVKLPSIFSDHAVFQREAKVPVWGFADAGEEVTVSFAGQTKRAKAGADGRWRVELENLKPGAPGTLVVKGTNEVSANDILVGEVWLGSGQSNMAMTVSRAKDFEAEKAAARTPDIRMFTVTSGAATTPQADCVGKWVVCSPETVGTFSATAYFFGKAIHGELKVPVGLINSSVGGTPIESWISPDAQAKSPELKGYAEAQAKAEAAINLDALKAKYETDLAEWKEKAKEAKAAKMPVPRPPRDPSVVSQRKGNVGGLFNGKIQPLVGYAIRGALWYQGEANSADAKAPFYQHQLPLLVTDWRARWGYEFPFAWVQLPNFTRPGDGWSLVREAMLKTLKLPKTGMAITIDIGDPKNIHPANKQAVGQRLALWAMGTVYGGKGETSGPLPAGHEIKGGEVVVRFSHTTGGLVAKGGDLKGFAIAGEDKQWHDASARIEGENRVVVTSPEVPHPVALRYAWKDNPEVNLTNGRGLPASPFRTDDWAPKVDDTAARRAEALKAREAKGKAKPKAAPAN